MPAVHVDQLDQCSRVSFGWANAMLVTLVESALGYDCGSIAEQQRLAHIKVGGRVAGVKPCLRALVGGGFLLWVDPVCCSGKVFLSLLPRAASQTAASVPPPTLALPLL